MSASRQPAKHDQPLEVRLADQAKRLRIDAKSLPPGSAREALLRRAKQADIGSSMSEFLRGPVQKTS